MSLTMLWHIVIEEQIANSGHALGGRGWDGWEWEGLAWKNDASVSV